MENTQLTRRSFISGAAALTTYLALGGRPLAAHADSSETEEQTFGAWSIEQELDEFKMPTDESYLVSEDVGLYYIDGSGERYAEQIEIQNSDTRSYLYGVYYGYIHLKCTYNGTAQFLIEPEPLRHDFDSGTYQLIATGYMDFSLTATGHMDSSACGVPLLQMSAQKSDDSPRYLYIDDGYSEPLLDALTQFAYIEFRLAYYSSENPTADDSVTSVTFRFGITSDGFADAYQVLTGAPHSPTCIVVDQDWVRYNATDPIANSYIQSKYWVGEETDVRTGDTSTCYLQIELKQEETDSLILKLGGKSYHDIEPYYDRLYSYGGSYSATILDQAGSKHEIYIEADRSFGLTLPHSYSIELFLSILAYGGDIKLLITHKWTDGESDRYLFDVNCDGFAKLYEGLLAES